MIDLRIWRIALLAVPVVITIAMFSLREAPQEISPGIPPDAFDPTTATPLAKELAEKAPDPRPGSEADQLLADQVEDRFTSIPGAAIAEQRFEGSFRGDEVELRNLIATLPGESERQIAVLAPRDAAGGSGALTSIASTAALLEIANGFSGSVHNKTLVFVSTDGSSIGALGARRFVRDYSDSDRLDAAIVLSQPAAPQPRPPLVIPWSTGDESTSSQLADTANSTVSKETDTPAGDEGPLDDLFRLALPAGLGEQGPLVEAGLPAVRLSSDGELPIDPAEDDVENFGTDTFDRFGRATLALILSLDSSSEPIEHGPRGYIGIAGNLLPGWTIGLLALSLLVPVALAAGVGLASAARSPIEAARGQSGPRSGRCPSSAPWSCSRSGSWSDWSRARNSPSIPGPRGSASSAESRSRSSRSATRPSRSSCGRFGRRRGTRPRARLRRRSWWHVWRRSGSG